MQTSGTLAETSLATLLEAMQSERATGTLSVTHDEQNCSLYFLFGHLFHAAADAAEGEDAVVTALGWPEGDFTFDPRAKLPAEETIKSGTQDLLAQARRRSEVGDSAGAGAASTATADAAAPAFGLETTVDEPAYTPAEPVGSAAPRPSVTSSAPYVPAQQPANGERRVPDTASSSYGRSAGPSPQPVLGMPDAPPISELYPLPSGKPIYEALKSAFVDFPKLLRTLDTDKQTGYVRLEGDGFSGVLLLHDGHVLEALYSEGRITQATEAFQQLRRRMEAGEGLLDVIELSGETVVSLAQLLTARPLFTGLLGRFINFEALLEYLAEEKIDGSLVVTGGTETGVILLRKGTVLGAYTQSERDLSSAANAVTGLATEREARIEVKSGKESPPGIDVDAALRQPV